ncbi:hypothetical protein [Vibrio mediterranei]|uniref:Uncharacterized protein n=1 Tax=Vibrio mediterranei TaxID=689 RepID=A0AAN1FIL1_9VIBR|nr:hypothetical protein [Vibrio mediterranei]ASI90967.1 hypothetical protein BSZ05_14845 [Vibrio mediterranei]
MKRNEAACNSDLKALDLAENLEKQVTEAITKIKDMDLSKIASTLPRLLLGGGDPFAALGLDPKLFEQVERLTMLNRIARDKCRAFVMEEKASLVDEIENAEVVSDEQSA